MAGSIGTRSAVGRAGGWLQRAWSRTRSAGVEAGMTTAEYAVGTVAAVAFAAVLYKVVRSPAVQAALSSIVAGALSIHL